MLVYTWLFKVLYEEIIWVPCDGVGMRYKTFYLLLSTVLVFSSSCGSRRVAPSVTGGVKLAGTEELTSSAGFYFSLSPDGYWLVFESQRGSLYSPILILHEVDGERRFAIRIGEAASRCIRTGEYVDLGRLQWDAQSRELLIPSASDRCFYSVNLDSGNEEFLLELEESSDLRSRKPRHLGDADAFVRVVKLSDKEALVVDANDPERILARHRLEGLVAKYITIEHLSISPDHDYVAYSVAGMHGGSYALDSRGYIVPLDGSRPPQLLAAPVYGPIIWHPTKPQVFAFAADTSGKKSIHYWNYGSQQNGG